MTNSLEANFGNQGSKIINIIKRKRRKPVTPEEPVHLHLASSSLPYEHIRLVLLALAVLRWISSRSQWSGGICPAWA